MATKASKNGKSKSKSNGNGASNGHSKKPKQLAIAGTERKVHPDIEEAAEEYVEARDTRMEWSEQESAKQEALHAAMKKHGLTRHVVDVGGQQQVVEIVAVDEKVRVRRYDPEKEARKAARKVESGQSAGASA